MLVVCGNAPPESWVYGHTATAEHCIESSNARLSPVLGPFVIRMQVRVTSYVPFLTEIPFGEAHMHVYIEYLAGTPFQLLPFSMLSSMAVCQVPGILCLSSFLSHSHAATKSVVYY